MSEQIFKQKVEKELLYNFLVEITDESTNNSFFLLSKTSYKRARFHKKILLFYEKILDNYYNCKKRYITRAKNYKNFITVIRQICKSHCIPFISKIKYQKSTYEIQYFIKKWGTDLSQLTNI